MSTRCYKSSRCKAIKGLDLGYGCQLKGPKNTAMPDHLTNEKGTRCNPGFRVCPDRRCYPSEWFAEGKDVDEVDRFKNMSAKDTLKFLKGRYTTTYKNKAKKLPFSGQSKHKFNKKELGSIVHGFGAQRDPAAMAAFAKRSAAAKKAAATRKANKASKKSSSSSSSSFKAVTESPLANSPSPGSPQLTLEQLRETVRLADEARIEAERLQKEAEEATTRRAQDKAAKDAEEEAEKARVNAAEAARIADEIKTKAAAALADKAADAATTAEAAAGAAGDAAAAGPNGTGSPGKGSYIAANPDMWVKPTEIVTYGKGHPREGQIKDDFKIYHSATSEQDYIDKAVAAGIPKTSIIGAIGYQKNRGLLKKSVANTLDALARALK